MSRISRLDRSEVTPEMAVLYDKVFAQRGNVPNMFRVMAHRPEIFATMQAHFGAVLNTGTVPTKLKELIIVRTSQVNETPYCLASHTILARNLGWSDDQLSHLADWPQRDDFTPAEKAALRLAETVTRAAKAVSDEQFAELRSFYSEGEIVELLCAIGLFNYFNRFNNALKMEPTKPGEGGCHQRANITRWGPVARRRQPKPRQRGEAGLQRPRPQEKNHPLPRPTKEFPRRMKLSFPAGEFRGYLFDCDGTIADSMPLHYIAWKKALGEWGCTFDEELFYAWGGMPTVEIVAALNRMQGLKMPAEAVAGRKENLYYDLLPQLKPVPEVLEHIEAAQGRIPFAVVSGSSRESIIKTLTAVHLLDRFNILVGSDDYGRSKPAPDAFLIAAAGSASRPGIALCLKILR